MKEESGSDFVSVALAGYGNASSAYAGALAGAKARWPRHCAARKRKPRPKPGFLWCNYGESGQLDQNVMLQLSILPVSCVALSFTRSFHVPLSASLDRLNVTVVLMLSVPAPVWFQML